VISNVNKQIKQRLHRQIKTEAMFKGLHCEVRMDINPLPRELCEGLIFVNVKLTIVLIF